MVPLGQAFSEGVTVMSHLLEHILALCGQNAPAIALLAAFLESLIGVGVILPGGMAVVLAGFTARDGGPAGFLSVALMAWLGMTLGSCVDYWLGRVAGRRLVPAVAPWRLASRWRRLLRSSRRFLGRWGWWAILLANLAGPGRSSIAVASGASGWSFRSFFVGQSIAAAMWSTIYVGIGYFAAGEAARLEHVVSGAGLAGVAVFVLVISAQAIASTLVRLAARRLRPRAVPSTAA
jgi:membrane protein DedA with SNARE-associated domain